MGPGQDEDRHGRTASALLAGAAPPERGGHQQAPDVRGGPGEERHGPGGAHRRPHRHRRHGAAHRAHCLRQRRGAGLGVPPRRAGEAAGAERKTLPLPRRAAGGAGRVFGPAGGRIRPSVPGGGGRAALLRPGGWLYPSGLRPGGGQAPGHPQRRQERHRRCGGPGD